jgi:hypothetical protein
MIYLDKVAALTLGLDDRYMESHGSILPLAYEPTAMASLNFMMISFTARSLSLFDYRPIV